MISVINYGLGNLQSLSNALTYLGHKHIVTYDLKIIEDSEIIVLPGVGNFGFAMNELIKKNLNKKIIKHVNDNKKLIAICLGMQLLLTGSEEDGSVKGLNIINGTAKKLKINSLGEPLPHISWKNIELKKYDKKYFFSEKFYFVHSYYCDVNNENIFATTKYNDQKFASIISTRNCFGVQFHPEKSGDPGLELLNYFLKR
jgi:glutamine amidotransferase